MECYLEKFIFPYVDQKRSDLQLHHSHPALLIFDDFNGQCTEQLLKLLESRNIHTVIIPANCTDRLQPLDISVNKPVKHFYEESFRNGMLTDLPPIKISSKEAYCSKIKHNETIRGCLDCCCLRIHKGEARNYYNWI